MRKRRVVQLERLEAMKRTYGAAAAQECESVLGELPGATMADAHSLIRFHDVLLFLRAFPQSARVARMADELLAKCGEQASKLARLPGADETFDDERFAGIDGTAIRNAWTLELARALVHRHSERIGTEWDADEHYRLFATILPNCIPLLDDDSYVEADTPYFKWIRAAAGSGKGDAGWVVESFTRLPAARRLRTSLYDALGVQLRWDLRGSPASRTLARRPVLKLFCHSEPLLQRKQVSLLDEMASPALPLRSLPRKEAQQIIALAQDALAVRYRELQGSTYGDPGHAFRAGAGRGVQLFIWGLDAEWRLPLRGYYAGFTLKNGVPINYFEAIGLCEWMEVGFNTFFAFREGETAWIYSKVLHLLHQLAGVTCISVYPYQIGQDNEEAIQSGAFWFYRKLGFRPGRAELLEIAEREENRMVRDPAHRTSARTLRKLAQGNMFFEFGGRPAGQWDTFSTRNLGLEVQRMMASDYDGDAGKMRCQTAAWLSRQLGISLERCSSNERRVLEDFSVALSLTPELTRWTPTEKKALIAILRTKAKGDETRYFRLTQGHDALRVAFLRSGSARISRL